jgi:hypothetical protein
MEVVAIFYKAGEGRAVSAGRKADEFILMPSPSSRSMAKPTGSKAASLSFYFFLIADC